MGDKQVLDASTTQFDLVGERDEAIQDISKKIACIHEIYQDLGALVVEQGEMVDTIEEHTTRTHERTRAGLGELEKAREKQSRCVIS